MTDNMISSYTLEQAIADGVLVPVFQNPAAGAFFNPRAGSSLTPPPRAAALEPAGGASSVVPALRPPNTGDAGLALH